eukprot:6432282-Heterocapsa_arctica.AAC.1
MARQHAGDEEGDMAEQRKDMIHDGSNDGNVMDLWREPPRVRVGFYQEDGPVHRAEHHGIRVREGQSRSRGGEQGDGRCDREQEGDTDQDVQLGEAGEGFGRD